MIVLCSFHCSCSVLDRIITFSHWTLLGDLLVDVLQPNRCQLYLVLFTRLVDRLR